MCTGESSYSCWGTETNLVACKLLAQSCSPFRSSSYHKTSCLVFVKSCSRCKNGVARLCSALCRTTIRSSPPCLVQARDLRFGEEAYSDQAHTQSSLLVLKRRYVFLSRLLIPAADLEVRWCTSTTSNYISVHKQEATAGCTSWHCVLSSPEVARQHDRACAEPSQRVLARHTR